MVNKKIWLGVAVTVATTIAVGTTVINHVKADTDDKTVTVGIVGDSSRELWENVSKRTEKKYGVKIKIKVFSDYVKPNQALVDGSLDLNAFQTKVFFDDQNKKLGNKLVSIGKTVISPIRLYSLKHDKLADLKDGAQVVIPNDATNEQRALNLLVQAKLIKYNESVDTPTVKDITDNPKKLDIVEIASDQTVSALKSADAAVINGNYAQDAGLKTKNVLLTQDVSNPKTASPYINIIAARKDKAKTKAYREIVKVYQTKTTEKEINKLYNGFESAAWNLK
ncbi:MAG: MetQ/NlpA family ABC transporter substrate-binding protein [Weissella confusa]|uniref:Lipoprotein n=1 Tax=Weissella confusa TaxID=1583 RepID=A0A4Z0RM05_WEICO|nr:MetQ/NlpA family ABC transporter substrate-binding protein [Weissella confusa]MBJ7621684.1 MetQ/NlpA family ABC transporter substrate-binding protein [Weissella confusa]MBJ7633466.1 MetQ/NlpA family ABC transporter substrate-binding protein [Weissella confusa]MBJ7638533.1 MetQ/NlpA family ABC transporter substrate-binding protein [Weissella confusa]MBJ7646315.1 MetQ/NlpA family ABC transporter substrate-binding protein [Weissella confusa]MBJ7668702.1 MetQ/NlpA family ABC transporter substra